MKKLTAIILSITMLLALPACSARNDVGDYYAPSGGGGYKGEDGYKGDGVATPDGVPGAGVGPAGAGDGETIFPSFGADDSFMEGEYVPAAPGADGAGAPDGGAVDVGGDKVENGNVKPAAGTLTAGEWKDLDDLGFWKELLLHNDWYALMESRSLYPDAVSVVRVKDEQDNPCFNAKVEILDESKAVLYTAVTDVTGRAYLTHDLQDKGNSPKTVRVGAVETPLAEGPTLVTIESGTTSVTALDLMLTVDTTGSMWDELRYLQKELEDVIERIDKASGEILSINVSVNFYRDEGDNYVVRPFEFTSDVSEAIKNLNDQSASGGGDYPEAVHTALENSVNGHQWRENSVKLLFFVLDAPPHSEKEINGIDTQLRQTVTEAAEKGIRIIPVASSGVDTETEFLMRSYAVMTGGTYIFLTNHSGVGNDHLEPTIGEYQVEALNDCLVRVIKEYCALQ